jgi:hypothetical protein
VNIQANIGQTAKGRVRIQVVDSKTGRVKRDNGWQKNLILNTGLDMIAVRTWADCFTHCAVSTGTTATQVDSGTTTAERAAAVVTLSGGSFVFANGDVGNTIKWASGEVARITVFTSTTQVTVATSGTIAAGLFTLYRTNQTGLAVNETKTRTNTYLTGTGNCGTTYTAATGNMVMRRTYDFTAEAGAVTYTEVGISYTGTIASNNLFSRILLSPSVTLDIDDQLRVIYELDITQTPCAPRSVAPTITGWGSTTPGNEMMENYGLYYVNTSGVTASDPASGTSEPSFARQIWISDSTAGLQSVPSVSVAVTGRTGTTFKNKAATLSTYAASAFTRNKSISFTTTEGNMSGIKSIVQGHISGNSYPGLAFLLDNAQEKLNTKTLSLIFTYTWGRTL